MCLLALILGMVSMLAGAVLVIRFFVSHGPRRSEVADVNRTESMLIGALLVSIGFLLTALGATGTICQHLGIG